MRNAGPTAWSSRRSPWPGDVRRARKAQIRPIDFGGSSASPSNRSSKPRPRARGPGQAAAAVDAGLRAVMFTDIVGSTEMTARLGDSADGYRVVRPAPKPCRAGRAARSSSTGRWFVRRERGLSRSHPSFPMAVNAQPSSFSSGPRNSRAICHLDGRACCRQSSPSP
jgi:hypothetical protein